jgi:hypothetical protein
MVFRESTKKFADCLVQVRLDYLPVGAPTFEPSPGHFGPCYGDVGQHRVTALHIIVKPRQLLDVLGTLPVLDIFPGDDIVLVFWSAVEEFEQNPVMEYSKLDSGIAPGLQNLSVVRDRLLVLPNLIYNVLKSVN